MIPPLFPILFPVMLSLYKQSRQEKLQKETWEREDNAAQRRVEDYKKAGLSPTLTAGSGAQASPATPQHPLGPEGDMINMLLNIQRETLNAKQLGAITMKTNAETANLIRNLSEAKKRGGPVGAQPSWIESLITGFARQIEPGIDKKMYRYTTKTNKKAQQTAKYGGNIWQWLWKKQNPLEFWNDMRNFRHDVLQGHDIK